MNYYLNRVIFSIWVLFWFIRLCLKLYNDYRSLDIWDVVRSYQPRAFVVANFEQVPMGDNKYNGYNIR